MYQLTAWKSTIVNPSMLRSHTVLYVGYDQINPGICVCVNGDHQLKSNLLKMFTSIMQCGTFPFDSEVNLVLCKGVSDNCGESSSLSRAS